MGRHTPGPWSLVRPFQTMHGWFWAVSMGDRERALLALSENAEANARLIAAAPEMLGALNGALSAGMIGSDEITAMREAVKKAEGK